MNPFPVLPFLHTNRTVWRASGIAPASSTPYQNSGCPTTNSTSHKPPLWATTTTAAPQSTRQLGGPGEQSENQQEEDADDLELEIDEDPSKLRSARTRPGLEDGSTAARGGDGTINPPFP